MKTIIEQFNRKSASSKENASIAMQEIITSFSRNLHAVPKVSSVTISMTPGMDMANKSISASLIKNFSNVTCRTPVITKAKISVSSFKVRAGMPVGLKTTLRKDLMWSFLDKLVHVVIPSIKDFTGLKEGSLDSSFNYNIGIKDYTVFKEVDFSSLSKTYGMNISIHLENAFSKESSLYLLRSIGLPIKQV